MATTTVSLPDKQLEWVRENHLSLSSIIQDTVKDMMDGRNETRSNPKKETRSNQKKDRGDPLNMGIFSKVSDEG